MANLYVDYGNGSSTGHYAVAQWAASHVYAAGSIVRQLAAPAVGSERCFRTALGGTSGGSEPSWDLYPRSSQPTDGTITDWVEVTGLETYNWSAPFARLNSALSVSANAVVSVVNGGTSGTYVVGDLLTILTSSLYGTQPVFRVSAVSAGKVTAMTRVNGGSHYSAPGGTLATSGGGGAGCTVAVSSTRFQALGDKIFVASSSQETQATTLTLNFNGTFASPDVVLCVNKAGSVPPVSADLTTGASVSTTGSGATLNMSASGTTSQFIQGIAFQVGSGSNNASLSVNPNGGLTYLKNGALNNLGTSGTFTMGFNGAAGAGCSKTILDNTTVSFGFAGNSLTNGGGNELLWKNTPSAIQGATLPTTLFSQGGGTRTSVVTLDAVDLSALGSGKTLFGAPGTSNKISLINCKVNASVTISGTPSGPGARVIVQNSDSGATGYRWEIYDYSGTLTTETTIVRAGGAVDNGQAISHKIVTTANAGLINAFETEQYNIPCDVAGVSKTLTIPIINDGTTLTNAEVWVEAQYEGSSATPIASAVSSGLADILATAANVTTDSTTSWTTTGLSSPVKQKLQVTFTPQLVGIVRFVVKVARASKTIYLAPPVIGDLA